MALRKPKPCNCDVSAYLQVLYSSLNQLMRHEGNVEEDIMATFTLSRTNMFGDVRGNDITLFERRRGRVVRHQ